MTVPKPFVCLLVVLIVSGCASSPEVPTPYVPRGFEASWSRALPADDTQPSSTSPPWIFSVQWIALETNPGPVLRPPADEVRITSIRDGKWEFAATSELARGGSWSDEGVDALSSRALGRSHRIFARASRVENGETWQLVLHSAEAGFPTIQLNVTPIRDPEARITVTAVLEDATRREELTFVEPLRPDLVLLVPIGGMAGEAAREVSPRVGAIVATLHGEPDPTPDEIAAFDEVSRAAAVPSSVGGTDPGAEEAALPPLATRFPGFREGIAALAWSTTQRKALLNLAGDVGASLSRDLALVADPELVQTICESLRETLASHRGAEDAAALAWCLETNSLLVLAAAIPDGIPPELESVLWQHTGEARRHPLSLENCAATSEELEALRWCLVEENFIFLQDSSPDVRVRAFDWLRLKKRAPDGYDPLSSRESRRSAILQTLEKWEEDPPR